MSELTRKVRYMVSIRTFAGQELEAEIRSMEIPCTRGGTLERHYAVLRPSTTGAILIWPEDLEALLRECALKDHKLVPPAMYDDDDPCVE